MRKLVKGAAFGAALLVIVATVLYAFGGRVMLDGGGRPYVAFVPSSDERAAAIARHREAQRAQQVTPTPPVSAAPAESPADSGAPTAIGAPEGTATDSPPAGASSTSATVATAPANASLEWTSFRGPARDGHYRGSVRTDWPASGLTPLWKQPAGEGYASFVAAGGRAFTIEQRGQQEVVAAYDVMTGREIWTHAWNARFSERMGGDGPRATPTWHDGRVYALGGAGELRALDAADGRQLWRTNILSDASASNLQWGMSGAPLLVDGNVIVTPGGRGGRSVIAYDANTGRRAWSALDDGASYSSPMLVTLGGVRQILVFTRERLLGLTTDGTRVLWEYPWRTSPDVNASQPLLIGDNRVFVSTGYGKGAAVIELTRDGDGFAVREVWRNIRMKNQFTSSVLHEGFIYGLDESILACIDASTGDLKWKGGRYGYGQIMLAAGHLIVLTEGGDLALVRATPERHIETTRFTVFDARTWNHPAIANGILLVRNLAEMAAFDLRVQR